MIGYNLTGQNLSVFLNGRVYTLPRSAPNFERVMEAIDAGDESTVLRELDAKQTIATQSEGRMAYDGRQLTFDGEPIHNVITDRLYYLWSNGLPFNSLLRFMDRLIENPSKRAVDELYRFLEACELPITPDGYFLAYKRIRDDFTDCYTGTFDNSIGATPRIRRNEVDEDSDRTCSHGLHVCSAGYLGSFWGDRVVVVKVDPADVVAVPRDYNNSKMRVCGYEVIQDITDDFRNGRHEQVVPSHFSEPERVHDYMENVEDEDDWFDDDIEDIAENQPYHRDGLDDIFDDEDEDDPVEDIAPAVGPSSHATTSKLKEDQVREIKKLLASGTWQIVRLAEVFGVNESTIRKIRDGVTWPWVK